jgi:cytochrome c oxidase cbb3-type subunit I/II
MEMQQFYYDNKIVKKFIYATIVFGIVGMTVGLLLATLFLFPNLTDGVSWLSFGRLRPLHTNAVIFFSVEMQCLRVYSLQRLLKARMFSDFLSNLNFWAQLIHCCRCNFVTMGHSSRNMLN